MVDNIILKQIDIFSQQGTHLAFKPDVPVTQQNLVTLLFKYRTEIVPDQPHFSPFPSPAPRLSAGIVSVFGSTLFLLSTQLWCLVLTQARGSHQAQGPEGVSTKLDPPYLFFAQFWYVALCGLSLSSPGHLGVQWKAPIGAAWGMKLEGGGLWAMVEESR